MARRSSSRDAALELPGNQGSVQAGTTLSFERAGRWKSSREIKVRLCAEGDRRPMSPRLGGFSVRSCGILCPFSPPQHPTPLSRSLAGWYISYQNSAEEERVQARGVVWESLQLIDLVTACRLCPARATRWLYRTLLPFCFVGPRSHAHSPAT